MQMSGEPFPLMNLDGGLPADAGDDLGDRVAHALSTLRPSLNIVILPLNFVTSTQLT